MMAIPDVTSNQVHSNTRPVAADDFEESASDLAKRAAFDSLEQLGEYIAAGFNHACK